ncbi:hypothetical protein [Natronogracilivirga saccharolytica]|uniref:Uncharacterized protein n=1 Tax=Natronogracilivirga saccharolytica TaxID=2812953 RepID=A0A8J7UW67_9BACT|nr:hypothetical protein [Natronogracilivirga saccharolytica]MBP3191904.1 hypothetical protein [Natronogracilivirga saccharolytica]
MNPGYIISTIIAGLVLLSLIALNARIMQSGGEQTLYNMTKIQTDLASDLIAHDFRSMGYGIQDSFAVTAADTNRIRFLTHFEGDENPTEIEWYFDQSEDSPYENPDIRPLRRLVNGDEEVVIQGVTRFHLEFYDSQRQPVDPQAGPMSDIRQIRVELFTESRERFSNNRFERSTWTGELTPFNLN